MRPLRVWCITLAGVITKKNDQQKSLRRDHLICEGSSERRVRVMDVSVCVCVCVSVCVCRSVRRLYISLLVSVTSTTWYCCCSTALRQMSPHTTSTPRYTSPPRRDMTRSWGYCSNTEPTRRSWPTCVATSHHYRNQTTSKTDKNKHYDQLIVAVAQTSTALAGNYHSCCERSREKNSF